MAEDYKSKVFDEQVFKLCNLIFDLPRESLSFSRQAVLDALSYAKSVDEVNDVLETFRNFTPAVLDECAKEILDTNMLFGAKAGYPQYLMTVRHLAALAVFKHWRVFFSTTKSIPSGMSFEDYLMTIRHLAELADFNDWEDFFSTVKSLPEKASSEEFFMTIRHLVGLENFKKWVPLFLAIKSFSSVPAAAHNEFFQTTRFLIANQTDFFSESYFTLLKKIKDEEIGVQSSVFQGLRHSSEYFFSREAFEGIFRMFSEFPQYSDALAYGQLDSKKWLILEAKKVWGEHWGETVFVLAGWIGLLPRMMYDQQIKCAKIRSFDLDAKANIASEIMNQGEVQKEWAYKASTKNITQMCYPTTYEVLRKNGSTCELIEMPDVVINTSCEHIQDIDAWWKQIPLGTKVILQSNDGFHIPEHVACFKTLVDFAQAMKLTRVDYQGEKALPEFKRFMLIGLK